MNITAAILKLHAHMQQQIKLISKKKQERKKESVQESIIVMCVECNVHVCV